MTMPNYERLLSDQFSRLEIAQNHQNTIKFYLELLKEKDNYTYEHSIRVGILGARIAEYKSFDPKALFFPGIFHDIGKIFVNPDILRKKKELNDAEWIEIKNHPIHAYIILKPIHSFSAEVVLRHHRYQENGYPDKIPEFQTKFSAETRLDIDAYARLVVLADFYDAINTRENEKYGSKKLSGDEVKSTLLEKNPYHRELIEELYCVGIFVKNSGPGEI